MLGVVGSLGLSGLCLLVVIRCEERVHGGLSE